MERRSVQYSLRLPADLYEDAVDVALVFDLSLNRLLAAAIEKFVASQLQREPTLRAIERIREARSLGLATPSDDADAHAGDAEMRRR